jgi:hypothetical protein
MRHFYLVEKLGGKTIGTNFLQLVPRPGDHIIGPDRKVWRIDAVGYYSDIMERPTQGPFGELQVTAIARKGMRSPDLVESSGP